MRQIDHIIIATNDPEKLFAVLSGNFQLPIVWPLSSYGSFTSGGVAVGNVNLEIIKDSRVGNRSPAARFIGFALEPEPLQTVLPQLDLRGIKHGKAVPFRLRQSFWSSTTLWTSVSLYEVSSETVNVFFCEYKIDVAERRKRSLEQLKARDGGPLSIESVSEVVYGTSDAGQLASRWQKLLAPITSSSDLWQVGSGPAIRLVQSDTTAIQGLVLRVKSLQKARQYLGDKGMLGTDRPGSVTIGGAQFRGLSITFVE